MSTKKKDTEKTIEVKSKTFGQDEANKLALSLVPKDEKVRYGETPSGKLIDRFDVLFVTSDKNVFFKSKEGQARNHASRNKLELFTVKNISK